VSGDLLPSDVLSKNARLARQALRQLPDEEIRAIVVEIGTERGSRLLAVKPPGRAPYSLTDFGRRTVVAAAREARAKFMMGKFKKKTTALRWAARCYFPDEVEKKGERAAAKRIDTAWRKIEEQETT
jgi:hypothetical protein